MSQSFSFDLVSEPWIHGIDRNGRIITTGIKGILEHASDIVDLVDDAPHFKLGVMRPLLAVVQRVFCPRDLSEWKDLWKRGLDSRKIAAYLDEYREHFDLFNQERPFLQWPELDDAAKPNAVQTLTLIHAAGQDHFLFDAIRRTDEDPASFTPAYAARALLAHLTMAPCGGKSEPGYLADAPSVKGVTVMLSGESLEKTLILNTLVGDYAKMAVDDGETDEDVPAWEWPEPPVLTAENYRRGSRGVLDYLTWASRRIKLLPETTSDGTVVVRRVMMRQGYDLPARNRQPFFAYAEEDGLPLAKKVDRSMWRHATTLIGMTHGDGGRRSLPVEQAAELVRTGVLDRSAMLRVTATGAHTKQNKIRALTCESMPLPLSVLDDAPVVDRLRRAMLFAEQTADAISMCANEAYRIAFVGDRKLDDLTMIHKMVESSAVVYAFWSELETAFMDLVCELGAGHGEAEEAWKARVWLAMRRSWDRARDHAGTSARGLKGTAIAGSKLSFRVNRAARQAYEDKEGINVSAD